MDPNKSPAIATEEGSFQRTGSLSVPRPCCNTEAASHRRSKSRSPPFARSMIVWATACWGGLTITICCRGPYGFGMKIAGRANRA